MKWTFVPCQNHWKGVYVPLSHYSDSKFSRNDLKKEKKRGTAKDRSNNIQLTLQRIYVKFLTIPLPFPPSTSKLHRTFPYYFPNSFLSHCLMTPFPLRSLEGTGSPKEEWGLSQSSATLKK